MAGCLKAYSRQAGGDCPDTQTLKPAIDPEGDERQDRTDDPKRSTAVGAGHATDIDTPQAGDNARG